MVAAASSLPVSRIDSLPQSADVLRDSRRPLPAASLWTGTDLVQFIAGALWDKMPLAKLDLSLAYDRTELVRAYADSDQQLQAAASEVAGMLEAIRDAALLVRQDDRISPETREEWRRRQQESLDQSIRFPIVPPDTALNFKTSGEAGLSERLHSALRGRVQQFATDVLESLQGMAQHQIIGRIEWANGNDCRYTFQQFALTQELLRTNTRRKAIVDRQTRQRGVETLASEVLQNTFSVLRHEHELINARKHEITQTVFPIPQPVQALVKLVPEWLRPQLRVVEGTQIKERIGEVDVNTDQWTSEPRVVDRVLFRDDPALVLAGFVLRGWGEREVALETERLLNDRAADEQNLADRRRSQNRVLATVVGSGAFWSSLGLFFVAFILRSALCLYVSWGLGLLSVGVQYLAGELSPGSSGLVRGGRTLLLLLAVESLVYGAFGAGVGVLLLSPICGLSAAALQWRRR